MFARSATPAPMTRVMPIGPDDDQAPPPGSFWAVITATVSGTSRYGFAQIDESNVPTFGDNLSPAFRMSSTGAVLDGPAYEINQSTTVPVGVRVRVWPAADKTFYLFSYPVTLLRPTTAGSGSGSGSTPFPAPDDDGYPDDYYPGDEEDFRPPQPMCILGKWYVTSYRIQVISVGGRARLDGYDYVTSQQGCCACSGSGSGPSCDCCPPGYATSLLAYLFGPFGTDCADSILAGTLTYDNGVWEGELTDGTITAVAKLYCTGEVWWLESVTTLADCTMIAARVPLGENSGALVGVVGISGRTSCPIPEVEAAIAHPCATVEPGSGSEWSNDPLTPSTCDCAACPDGAAGSFAVRDFEASLTISGETLTAPRTWGLIHSSGCIWQQIIYTNYPATSRHWVMSMNMSLDQLVVSYVDDGGTTYILATYEAVGVCCGGNATDPVIGDLANGPVAPDVVPLRAIGTCGPCGLCAGAPPTLFAHFAGALSSLGTRRLTYDAGSGNWLGTTGFACGATLDETLTYTCDSGTGKVSIGCAGPSAVFSTTPVTPTGTGGTFSASLSGTVSGGCSGAFTVVVNAIP